MSDKTDFSAAEICRIIKACHESGVTSISLAGVEISFNAPEVYGQVPVETFPQTGEPVMAHGKDAFVDEGVAEEARVSQLLIDDPLGFETEVIDAMLNQQRIETNATVQRSRPQ